MHSRTSSVWENSITTITILICWLNKKNRYCFLHCVHTVEILLLSNVIILLKGQNPRCFCLDRIQTLSKMVKMSFSEFNYIEATSPGDDLVSSATTKSTTFLGIDISLKWNEFVSNFTPNHEKCDENKMWRSFSGMARFHLIWFFPGPNRVLRETLSQMKLKFNSVNKKKKKEMEPFFQSKHLNICRDDVMKSWQRKC